VWEWCADGYDEKYYRKSPPRNPPGPASSSRRVLRGGSWRYVPSTVRVANRYSASPVSSSLSMGFRCSSPRSPP
ncbi:SUMF1/EgtB/PvdO family nonheme iron enzyme, partial [Candidatus Poribacteria bacterium]|nr:SUMF1/EgtB/PvdO family nonheme iron enzyme [Candidatus Poribacteria bacterium]